MDYCSLENTVANLNKTVDILHLKVLQLESAQPPSGGIVAETDPIWSSQKSSYLQTSTAYNLFYPVSGNPAGFVTKNELPSLLIETDPIFKSHPAYSISQDNISLWNTVKNAFPVLGIRTQSTINERGWFMLLKSDPGNPFNGSDPLGSGASCIASFEGVNNGWVLMGQDGINTITKQTFDLYGALRNPSGGFYPAVRLLHTGNLIAGQGISMIENAQGAYTLSVSRTVHPEYADNTAAIAAGLPQGSYYRTGDIVKQVHP